MEPGGLNMRKVTFLYAFALLILGMAGYIGTGSAHVTALIPAFFGIAFFVCAVVAQRPHLRKHVMHVAVLLALVAFLGTVRGLLKFPALLSGVELERPVAVAAQSVMALLSLVFVALAVKSFIDARRKPAS